MTRRGWPALVLAMVIATSAVLVWQARQRQLAAGWLEMARRAPTKLDYFGDLQIEIDGGLTDLRSRVAVDHLAPSRTRYRYLGPDLDGVEMLIDGDRAVRTDPQTGQQVLRAADLLGVPMDLAGYRARVSAGTFVAGRPTVCVKLVRHHLIRELWLDREHGLPLRTQSVNPQGAATRTWFVQIAYDRPPKGIPGEVPADPGTVSGPLTVAELSKRVGFAVHEPQAVPAGFRLVETRQCACPCGCKGGTAQLVYSDGVGNISLFYTGADCQQCYASESACAACVDHHAALRLEHSAVQVIGHADNRVLVVAIGDAGEGELAKMAASVPTEPSFGQHPDS